MAIVAASSATTRASAVSTLTSTSSMRAVAPVPDSLGRIPHRLIAAVASNAPTTTSFANSVRP
jgi:hypothetical protein